MPRRSGNLGMRDLDIVAQDKRTGTMLARAGKRYVVVELLPGATSSFHGWMERSRAKALYRQLTAPAKANPRRCNPREWWKGVGERVKVRSWWDAYPVINGRQPYRISFWPEGKAAGKRIWRVRYGTSMESTLDRAEAVVKRVYPKASGFMIEPAQRDNPPRDPEFAGVFLLGQEPKKSGRVDGDTAVVESPHRTHAVMDRPFEVWVFGMVDPALGETWNYVTGPMARSAAVEMAKKLLRF